MIIDFLCCCLLYFVVVQVDEHLDMLAHRVPKWAQKITIRKRAYLKIDKNKDLNSITTELQRQVKRLQAP